MLRTTARTSYSRSRDQGIGILTADLPRLIDAYAAVATSGRGSPSAAWGWRRHMASAVESLDGSLEIASVEGSGMTGGDQSAALVGRPRRPGGSSSNTLSLRHSYGREMSRRTYFLAKALPRAMETCTIADLAAFFAHAGHSPSPSRAATSDRITRDRPQAGLDRGGPTGQQSVIRGAADGVRSPSPLGSPEFHSVDPIIASVRRTGGGREADGLEIPLGAPQTGHERRVFHRPLRVCGGRRVGHGQPREVPP